MCVYTPPLAPRVYIIHALRCIIIGCILNREAVHAYQELVWCCTLQTVYSVASRAGCWRRNIFQNKWGTKARILVMVGGGHAALVRRCLIYLRRPSGQVRISKDLGSGIWGTWQGWRGGRSKVSLFDSAAVFGHCWGFPSCPFSRFLFLPLFVSGVAFLFAFVPADTSSIGNVIY